MRHIQVNRIAHCVQILALGRVAQTMPLRLDVVGFRLHHAGCKGRMVQRAVITFRIVFDRDLPIATLRDLDTFPSCLGALRELGFRFVDYPQNFERRFLRKGWPRSVHLHVVEEGTDEDLAPRTFRDALLSSTDLRDEYAALKREAAEACRGRRAAYGELKGPFIRRVLETARRES